MIDLMLVDVAMADRAEKLRQFERAERLGLTLRDRDTARGAWLLRFWRRSRPSQHRNPAPVGASIPAREA